MPPPPKLVLTPDELRRHGITRTPVILTRLTVTHANPDSPFLAKHKEVIRQYDLLALTPMSDKALKQVRGWAGTLKQVFPCIVPCCPYPLKAGWLFSGWLTHPPPFQMVTQSAVEVDIIALSLEDRGTRFARKLLRMAKDRNMYFEVRARHDLTSCSCVSCCFELLPKSVFS